MNLLRLCLRNLVYHWRGNSAVFLGVVVGTAVLTGALLVGDSLRGSLRALALQRLGWVDEALVAPRFFEERLKVPHASPNGILIGSWPAKHVTSAILLQATAVGPGVGAARPRVRGVTVMGVSSDFWRPGTGVIEDLFDTGEGNPAVWINGALAHALGVSEKSSLTLRLQKPSAVPRESILGGPDKAAVEEWTLTVGRVLKPGEPGDHFSLRPEVGEPLVVYIHLRSLQNRLGLVGRCNALLAERPDGDLNEELRARLRLEDWGLVLRAPGDVLRAPDDRVEALFRNLDRNKDGQLQPSEWRNRLAETVVHAIDPSPNPTLSRAAVAEYYRHHRYYLSLESRNLLIEPFIAEKVRGAAEAARLRSAPTLVYLANSIASGKEEIPYSVVAALDPSLAPPLGPFLPDGVSSLADDQIVLADWKDSPLPKEAGEEVTLRYFPPEHHGDLKERSATFRLAGFVPLSGVSGDPDLTPEFPGITDKLTIDQWDPPFPYDNKRIKPRDEKYWREYRTTPKAYVSLKKGQQLWGSRFGNVTSFRLAPRDDVHFAAATNAFKQYLLRDLSPAEGGLVFRPVKANALQAAGTGTDFGQLFLGFSFFLIAAALLLVGLLFRLNLDRRAAEVGLLSAVGYRRLAIFLLLLAEGSVLAAAGAVVGTFLGLLYSRLLLQLLDVLWPAGGLGSFLQPHYTAFSLAAGAGASFAVSVLTIAWAARSLGKVPPRALLAGQTAAEATPGLPARSRWAWPVAAVSLLAAIGLLAVSGQVHEHEMRAMTFFGSGALLLTACLAAVSAWMRGARHRTVEGGGWWGVGRLGVRNAARHPARSLLTAGLLASAAFLVVAVSAFQRSAEAGADGSAAANGGFALVAESDLPLFLDLNTDDGREQVRKKLLPAFRDELQGDNDAAERRADEAVKLLRDTKVFAFRVHAGDDASCLNLYKPQQPRLLGVPDALLDRGGFQFADVQPQSDAERANPWLILRRPENPPPAFGEKNTVVWMLKSDAGKDIEVSPGVPVRVAGLLQDSIFQSSLLVSEARFLRLYPGHEGYNFFLIQTPPDRAGEVKRLLETALADRGFEATPTAQRLASYLAVENTYLSTFQALGGLGLVLGSLGLGVVLLRGVWERRGELALLRALGYRRGTLGWLVLAENAFLLVLGLAAGTLSALAAVAPHLAAGSVPWVHLLLLLALVLAVGLLAGAVATATTLRAPLVPALRRE
jgi:putative ABC transport system permease protein